MKPLKKIGWVGTGVMGKSMVRHLLKGGFELEIFNRTKSKTDELVSEGCKFATPQDMAQRVDVLILMVGYPRDLESLIFEQKQLDTMVPGSLQIDHTTSSPNLAVQIAKKAKELNIGCVDAPVSGGELGAINGQLVVMAGGEKQDFDRCKPIFDCYAKLANCLGGPGMGQHAKMANQVAIAGSMIGMCECLLYSHKVGLDVSYLIETIKGGAAGSASINLYSPKIFNRDFTPGFYVEHFVKDLEIALDECRRLNITLPGMALVHQLYKGLMAHNGGRDGTQALLKVLENLNNTEVGKY